MNIYLAEFIGTALMILLGNGVVANVVLKGTKGNNGGWISITTAWALAVFVGVVVAGPYSGAHLNPIVTLGLAIGKGFNWELVPFYMLAQLAGAMTGSFLVWVMYKDHFDATEDPGLKAAPFATAPAIRNKASNLVSEIIGTFVLIFVIFYFTDASMGTKENTTPIGLGSLGAIPVAFLVWVIGLALGGTTGYAINPARDLGPRIIHALIPMKGKGSSDWDYAWIPIIGPIAGATLAAVAYLFMHK
ncbi:MIP (Major intrinsic protein) family permease [Pedobacter kyungheensis]|uniref:MIP (Major intrinsic protein) family permease n=1 Tax=Pedobacter kyungheensis TaxID=1069985 RepID=A0A0C1FVP2_9SPHI|nr:MIP/aquaporin family protein [Pedobacter kyungheensis]KIA95948.1 MIP (Major intrinsic protein) family permease [Pedobacter kyungheensis]